MRYYRLMTSEGESRLAVEVESGRLADLTSVDEDLTDIEDLALAAWLSRGDIDEIVRKLLDEWEDEAYELEAIVQDSRLGTGDLRLDRPFEPPEVWGAGITYKSSEIERRRESDSPDVYSKVYSAARPELFLKATPDRCVGPFEPVGIRGDSSWNVPEPELAFVLYRGEIIGYTIGNDMSSRSIEGENPLYVPQAKIFASCCAIGPCFVTAAAIPDPHNLNIQCIIEREGEQVFSGSTSTSNMARKCDELADWLQRHDVVPNMTAVLTGTGIVPPDDFTLQEGDVVTIEIQDIGSLENDVIVV